MPWEKTPPLAPWEQFGGNYTKLCTFRQSRATCEGGNNLLIITNTRTDLLPEDLSPLAPHMAKTCMTPALRFLCWYQPCLWELLHGLQVSPTKHHHPETSSAAARLIPSPHGYRFGPCTQPGACLILLPCPATCTCCARREGAAGQRLCRWEPVLHVINLRFCSHRPVNAFHHLSLSKRLRPFKQT